MSIKVMSLVWDNFTRGGSEKLAMLALADWCNDQGGSLHPSMSTIAKKINVSESQARRIVHGFIDEGYLSVVANFFGGNPGQSRQYKLNVDMLGTPSMDATPSASATPSMDARAPLAPVRVTPSTHDTQPTNEPPIEPPDKATRLPKSWKPSQADIDYCNTKRPDLNPSDVFENFRDYWLAKPKDFKKSDWAATWRNWVRRQAAPTKKTVTQVRHDTANDMFKNYHKDTENERRTVDVSEDGAAPYRQIVSKNG